MNPHFTSIGIGVALLFVTQYMKAQTNPPYRMEKQVFIQKVIQEKPGVPIEYLMAPYVRGKEDRNVPPERNVLQEEVIMVNIYYGTKDTFAIATAASKEEFEAVQLRSSPANLTSDIPWDDSVIPFTSANIPTAFNAGRAGEEAQLGTTVAVMGIPAGTGDDLSLWLANDDRTARGGLAFEGLENNLDDLAQAHTDDMLTNNFFSHTGTNGKNPFTRIDDDPILGNNNVNQGGPCHEFLPRAENIAGFWTSENAIPLARARSQYNWVYDDASSAWGHRETSLLQDMTLSGGTGFNNNHESSTTEGFVGFGTGGSASYNPFNFSFAKYGELVVMNMIDPIASPNNCNYSIGSALPVELISFNAEVLSNRVRLNWSTATETNNEGFYVERSVDTEHWEVLGFVPGQGSTATTQNYQLIDDHPVNGINYYRLKQIDFDGQYEYSDVITASLNFSASIAIWPNPASTLIYTNQQATIKIYDFAGRLVLREATSQSFDVSQLKAGVYAVALFDDTGNRLDIKRLIINRRH